MVFFKRPHSKTRDHTLAGSVRPEVAIFEDPSADGNIHITCCKYVINNSQLLLSATCNVPGAKLTAYLESTGQLIGPFHDNGFHLYFAVLPWTTIPQRIIVKSSLGGTATAIPVIK